MSISAYGNKQVNIRLDSDLLGEIKDAAEKEGIGVQDWIRNACRSALGQSIPGAVGRSEFEAAIADLKSTQSPDLDALANAVLSRLTEPEKKQSSPTPVGG